MADYTENSNVQNFERYNSDGTKKKEKKSGKGGKKLGVLLGVFLVIGVFLLANCMVVTKQNQFKLIRQFGRVDRVVSVPGLSLSCPLWSPWTLCRRSFCSTICPRRMSLPPTKRQ